MRQIKFLGVSSGGPAALTTHECSAQCRGRATYMITAPEVGQGTRRATPGESPFVSVCFRCYYDSLLAAAQWGQMPLLFADLCQREQAL